MTGPDRPLRIVRSPSLASLADHLADHLAAAPPTDPFAGIEVVVPSRGVERWLTQRLSRRLGATELEAGVCANLGFPFLGGLVERVLAATLGVPTDAADPWAPGRLAWPLLALLDELPATPVFEPLRLHLTQDGAPAPRRRAPLARRLADLFDRYAWYRPDMVGAWRRGEDVDGHGAALPPNLTWQPLLWRQLSAMLSVDSPDRRTAGAIRGLGRGEVARPEELPGSVTVFGVLSLPPRQLELLTALSWQVPVTLYTLSPCTAWTAADHDPRPRHPLLAASGSVARQAHTVLAPLLEGAQQLPAPRTTGPAATALEVLQEDVRHDRRRGAGGTAPVRELPDGDDSIQVHACHGPLRQLEVLREVLLGLLDDDRTLEPRDIVVLTPDLEAYAPIVPAAFPRRGPGDADHDDVLELPVVVADRAGQQGGVASALLGLLELVTGRVTASQVLDLLATSPVRARFALGEADLDQLQQWLLDAGVSWGIDADHRRELIGVADDAHTWAAALDRWTLGAAMADDGTRLVGGVRPYDDVEGGGVELLGRVTAATEAVFGALRSLAAPRDVAGWRDALGEALTNLFDPGPGPTRDAELTAELATVRGLLDELVTDADAAGGSAAAVSLTLEEVRGLLEGALTAGARAVATGTGAVTVTGLVPLRSVPHRVVCLVGMDDGAVPGAGSRHGFDLLEAPSRPGDPDPRQEERQLVLDAVLAASEHLVITYSGHDPRTNEPLQPAVPVSELLDVLDAAFVGGAEVVRSHPLQPHSPRYFRAGGDGAPPLLHAFDPHHLAAARAAVAATGPAPGFLDQSLPPPVAADPEVIELDELVGFLEHPVRFLLRQRLGLTLGEDDRRLPDRDPTDLGPLERWRLGQELLALRLADAAPEQWRQVTMATGTAPVGSLGEVALEGIEELVDRLARVVEGIDGERRVHTVDVAVPVSVDDRRGEIRVVGTVEAVGGAVLHAGVTRPKARHRLGAWVRAVALLAGAPELCPTAVLVGGDRSLTSGVRTLALDPQVGLGSGGVDGAPAVLPRGAAAPATAEPDRFAAAELARVHLGALVSLHLRGHRDVLALLPETGAAYAAARAGGADHATALATAHHRGWVGRGPFGGERDDAYVVQAFGPDTDLATIDARYPLGAAAERVWRPILAGEVAS